MASSTRINKLNPQKLWLIMAVSGVLLLVLSTTGVIFLGLKQNQKVIQNENKMMLRRNGELLLHQEIRNFVEALGLEEQDYLLNIQSELDHQKISFGRLARNSFTQCSSEFYFQFEVELCRPPPISWVTISVVFLILMSLILFVAVFVRHLGLEIVASFQELFKVAKIHSTHKLNFGEAWKTAFSMAENFSESQRRLILAEKNQATYELSRQVAHDIRSPLTALNFLTVGLVEVSEEKRDLVKRAVKRIEDISNDLLKKSKTMSSSEINLKLLTEQIILEKNIEYENKIRIQLSCDDQDNLANFSEVELNRILSNLINNSVEAGAQNIQLTLTKNESEAKLIIQDDGRGIPEEIISNLSKNRISTKKQGHGLGLTHARTSIEAAGGSLSIESRHGLGTSVTIVLPR